MTGSETRGKLRGRFFYNHCSLGCLEGQRAKVDNDEFVALLSRIQYKSRVLDLYYEVVERFLKVRKQTVLRYTKKTTKLIRRHIGHKWLVKSYTGQY